MLTSLIFLVSAVAQSADLPGLFTFDDYPAEAIARKEQGAVEVSLKIDTDGRVVDCTIVGSSKSAALDRKTCEIFRDRARFAASVDKKGDREVGEWATTVRWALDWVPPGNAPGQPARQADRPPPRRFNCDAGPGEYSYVPVPNTAPGELAGKVRLLERKQDSEWLTRAGFVFQTNGKAPDAGLFADLHPQWPDELIVMLRGQLSRAELVVGEAPLKDGVKLSAKVDGSSLIATAAGQMAETKLTHDVRQPVFMCSGGRFELEL